VSINVWKLAEDTLIITSNFLYSNHQVHRLFDYPVYSFLWEVVRPAGSESRTKTEGHPLLTQRSAAFETKRNVSKNLKMFSGSKFA
jgi:hypothetical protein